MQYTSAATRTTFFEKLANRALSFDLVNQKQAFSPEVLQLREMAEFRQITLQKPPLTDLDYIESRFWMIDYPLLCYWSLDGSQSTS